MHQPITMILTLSSGSVTLRAWGNHVCQAYLLDLLAVTTTLEQARDVWESVEHGDIEPRIWTGFERLIEASLDGCTLPRPLTWLDYMTLLDAMWTLNQVDEAEGKLKASSQKAAKLLAYLKPPLVMTS